MADTKLSALLTSSAPGSAYYGVDASNNSRKFADIGFYNVKSYGAVGDANNDDTNAIQAAIDAVIASANPGGTVFFPAGIYKVTQSLTVPAANIHGLRFIGSGCSVNGYNGTVINGSVNGYLLKAVHNHLGGGLPWDNMAIAYISDIAFVNTYARVTDIADSETAGGGVYDTGSIGFSMRRCNFQIGGGIGFFTDGHQTCIAGCNFDGGFTGNNAFRSIGVFLQNGKVEDCKFQGLGVAVVGAANGGGYLTVDNVIIEKCGTGISVGYSPIQFWDFVINDLVPAGGYPMGGHIRCVGMESVGEIDDLGLSSQIYCANVNDLTIAACKFAPFGQDGLTPNYGLYISVASNCRFEGIESVANPGYSVAAVYIDRAQGCYFSNIYMLGGTAGGTNWTGPVNPSNGRVTGLDYVGVSGNSYLYCNTDGALTMDSATSVANFPLAPMVAGETVLCSDSQDPVWTAGGVSNVGKPVSAALTTNSSTPANNGTLHFSSAPSWLQNNWKVFNLTNPTNSLSGNTTITAISSGDVSITPNTLIAGAGVAVGDVIAFISSAPGTNRVVLRWTGASSNNDGAWRIAG